MRLQKLFVNNYKNLNNFNINFSADNVSLLIGTNGSGKSNILEVLSAIFSGLYKDPNPIFDFDCRIEYVIDDKTIAFIKDEGYKKMTLDDCDITYEEYISNRFEYLPKNIIALYSGDERRLYRQYYKSNMDAYNSTYWENTGINIYRQQMLYVDYKQWQLFAWLLNAYNIDSTYDNLLDKIGCNGIQEITINFNVSNLKNNKNVLVGSILELFNPNKEDVVTLDKTQLEKLHTDFLSLDRFEIFCNLNIAINSNYQIISDINIKFDSGVSLENMSEGNKKLLALEGVMELLADNKTLVLLDEPDTYIHEGRKSFVYELLMNNAKAGVCSVLTSHSPTLTNVFAVEDLSVLTVVEGNTSVLAEDKKSAISRLTDGIWCAEPQCILLECDKDLLLVEGKGDIKYIKKALDYFKAKEEKYIAVDLFILPFGGTGNCKDFIDNIIEAGIKNRKIIALFDADGAGREKFNQLVGNGGNNYTNKVYEINDFTSCLLLPKPDGCENNEFMIEDYFDLSGYEEERSRRYALCQGAKEKTNFKYSVKEYIKDHCDEIGYDGFEILLKKLYEIMYTADETTSEEENLEKNKELISA